MGKIIICDKNKELIDYLKANVLKTGDKTGIEFEFVCGDIIELHEKTENSRIVTASNPSFSPDGGLDAVLASKYSWEEATEFAFNNDLFFVVSVDEERKANEKLIQRALIGVLGYLPKFTLLLTGIGTGIGGLAIEVLGRLIVDVLSSANLHSANLHSANLHSADLSSANLSLADLRYANLSSADLSSANLSLADLHSADLSSADLRYANLSSANLHSADLSSANLRLADLRYANLHSADLSSANLRSAKKEKIIYNEGTSFFALSCPSAGSFVAWKKSNNGLILKLKIPAKAKRSSATTRKCRASEAKVIAIYDGKKKLKEAISGYDPTFVYKVGETVKPTHPYCEDRWIECTSGIHFFITREEAEQWNG